MKLNPYIVFKGNCEEAINFYKEVLNGEITQFMRFKEAPEKCAFEVSESDKNLVMHSTLVFNDCTLLASDSIDENTVKGSDFSLSINADDNEKASTIFKNLSKEGAIIRPFTEAFWGGKFGMLVDKFNIHWMISSNFKTA